jgi:hypothetical protein
MAALSSYTLKAPAASDFLLGCDSGGVVKTFDVGEFMTNGAPQTGLVVVRLENTAGAVPAGATGVGLELFGSQGGVSVLQSYNRTSDAYSPLSIGASTISFTAGSVTLNTNNAPFYFKDASGSTPFFVCQSDNNFIYYSTDAGGSPRAIFGHLARSNTSTFTFNVDVTVPDEAYGAGWNASTEVPTKNAIYAKVGALQLKTDLDVGAVKYDSAGSTQGSAITDYFTSTLSLDASSIYEIECHAYFLKTTAGTIIWTWAFSSAPTMVSSRIEATPITGFTTTVITGAPVVAQATVEAATTVAHAASGSLTNAVRHSFMFWVKLRTNAATTIQLRSTNSAGTITPQPGSYMRARKIA